MNSLGETLRQAREAQGLDLDQVAARTRINPKYLEAMVEIHGFRSTYFPPGYVAERVEFLHRFHKERPPLIAVRAWPKFR